MAKKKQPKRKKQQKKVRVLSEREKISRERQAGRKARRRAERERKQAETERVRVKNIVMQAQEKWDKVIKEISTNPDIYPTETYNMLDLLLQTDKGSTFTGGLLDYRKPESIAVAQKILESELLQSEQEAINEIIDTFRPVYSSAESGLAIRYADQTVSISGNTKEKYIVAVVQDFVDAGITYELRENPALEKYVELYEQKTGIHIPTLSEFEQDMQELF